MLAVLSVTMVAASPAKLLQIGSGAVERVSQLTDLSDTFAWVGYVGGLLFTVVAVIFCLAAFKKCFIRLPQQMDKEWF